MKFKVVILVTSILLLKNVPMSAQFSPGSSPQKAACAGKSEGDRCTSQTGMYTESVFEGTCQGEEGNLVCKV